MSTENKTKPTSQAIVDYLAAIDRPDRRAEIEQLVVLFAQTTGVEPVMWGPSIIGFGSYHYRYASGREGDFLRVGLSSRKDAITLYGLIWYDFLEANNQLLDKLGPHKSGKGCLYIKSLATIDLAVLEQMIHNAYHTKNPTEV